MIKALDDEEEEEGGRVAPPTAAGGAGGAPPSAGRIVATGFPSDAPGRPGREVRESTVITVLPDSSFVFIDRFNGASSGLDVEDVDDVDGLPIKELTSSASGFPFTV